MARVKVVSPAEAAQLIPSGAVVCISSSSGLHCPDTVLKAIGERFRESGQPHGLTTYHPIASGDMYGIATVVVSMGKEGAIFVEGEEAVWAVPPSVEVKSTVGAGDAMVAGTVASTSRGLSLAECARLSTAFSMTAISHIGSGLPSIEAVESARERVTIRRLAGRELS